MSVLVSLITSNQYSSLGSTKHLIMCIETIVFIPFIPYKPAPISEYTVLRAVCILSGTTCLTPNFEEVSRLIPKSVAFDGIFKFLSFIVHAHCVLFFPDLQHTGFLVTNNVSVFVSMIHLYV